MTVACKSSYTPTEMIAAVRDHFVTRQGRPGIDDKGRTVYPLANTERRNSGCAVYVLATINPEMLGMLAKIGTHENCMARDLPKKGVNVTSLLDAGSNRLLESDNQKAEFIQAIQSVHDHAATTYYNLSRDNKMSESDALVVFRGLMIQGLSNIAVNYRVEYPSIVAGKKKPKKGGKRNRIAVRGRRTALVTN